LLGDPFVALADIVVGVYKEKKVQAWARLIFMMGFSAVASFLFACGAALLPPVRAPWPIAIGHGFVWSAIALVVLFRSSPLTKNMMAVLPSQEAVEELKADVQTISK
jgi:hypothetical protein